MKRFQEWARVLAPLGGCAIALAVVIPASVGLDGTGSISKSLAVKSFTWSGRAVSKSSIPLGDGHVSIAPKVGYVDSCQTNFNGGGANGPTPWINHAKHTWSATSKTHVQGTVSWPAAAHSLTISGSNRTLSTNDLPKGSTTGTFPIQSTDPAYAYDRNPNSIAAQSIDWTVPANPTKASTAGCVSLGPIGVTTNGVVFFNALDGEGRDAVAHEMQDACGGHPDQSSEYHYHTLAYCPAVPVKKNSATLVGYALDGFGIYVERDSHGNLPHNADLDVCHGRSSKVMWNGREVTMYHYDVTLEYPYTVGCYRGGSVLPPH